MRTVCASGMPFAGEAFRTLGEAVVLDGRAIAAPDVRGADLLAVRSTTRVGRELLAGSAVRFVGTATIGFDHLDTAWLEQAGIRWRHSPGCNANSVSEYVAAALLWLARRRGVPLRGRTLGVIGVGNVGRLVAAKAEALGLRVLRNDPPRERAEGAGGPAPFVPLPRLLDESDAVTLHVPLTREGPDATFHMADAAFFARLKPGATFINSARGPVVETGALLAAIDGGRVAHAVIDTWEGEPAFRADLLGRADLGTPHIAGYSYDGKVAGTVRVYEEACRFLGIEPAWSPEGLLPPPPVPDVAIEAAGVPEEAVLHALVRVVYDIEADDARLREGAGLPEARRAAHFDRLRKEYPERREFRFTRARLAGGPPELVRAAAALGFQTR